MIKSIKKCVTPTLEEANRRIINYENEIAYCDRIIESLYEYIIEVKLTQIKSLTRLNYGKKDVTIIFIM